MIDLGLGNTGSILNMLLHLGVNASLSADSQEISQSDGLILAGVGAFDTAVEKLRRHNLMGILQDEVGSKRKPLLGICLGMQLLTTRSEEGVLAGLDLIPGVTRRFSSIGAASLRVPHMGWNKLISAKTHPLLQNLDDDHRFYFVHSYYVSCDDPSHVLATTNYGVPFDSVIANRNVYGTQFHPEKSHRFGMQVLKNFSNLVTA